MKEIQKNWKILVGLMTLTFVLSLIGLSSRSLSLDEISTINVTTGWGSMLHILWTQEGNMWLYYGLIHFVLKIGHDELTVRSLSVLAAVATIPSFFLLAHTLAGEKVAKLSSLLLVLNLYFIFYSQQARSYALALLFVTLSGYFFLKMLEPKASLKYLILYVLTSVLGIYSYLFVGLSLLAQYLAILFIPTKIPWKKMIIAGFSIWVLLAPLVLAPAFRGGHQLDWLQEPPLVFLPFGFLTLASDFVPLFFVYGALLVTYLFRERETFLRRTIQRFHLIWLVIWTTLPIVSAFAISYVIKPIYEPESFNTVLPAFGILVGIALVRLESRARKLYMGLLILILVLSVVRLGFWFSQSPRKQYVIENSNTRDWDQVEDYIQDRGTTSDAVIFYAYFDRAAVDYYKYDRGPRFPATTVEISKSEYDLGGGTRLPDPDFDVIESLHEKYTRVWLVLADNETEWMGRRVQGMLVESALSKSFEEVSVAQLGKIKVKLWERSSVPSSTHL